MGNEKDKDTVNETVEEYFLNDPHLTTAFIRISSNGSDLLGREQYRISQQTDNIKSLLKQYLDAVTEVKADGKLDSREALKKLLIPFAELHRIYFPNYLEYHEFIDSSISVDELNKFEVVVNPAKYDIAPVAQGYIEVDDPIIWISDQYMKQLGRSCKNPSLEIVELLSPSSEDRMSVSDIYQLWLPSLTQETMKSNDLLDRILIIYTIKRAANGDTEAIDKLYKLFEKTAIAIAVKLANLRIQNMPETKRIMFRRHLRDIKQEAKAHLRLLISGFSPENILQSLIHDKSTYLKIPKWITKFYIYWLSEKVPREIIKSPFDALMTGVILINPYTCIVSETEWRGSPKAVRKFNSFVFRPTKRTNLYTWLFGLKKEPQKGITSGFMQGRFCQIMSDRLDEYCKSEMEDTHDFLDEGDNEAAQEFKYRTKIIKDGKGGKQSVDDETIMRAIEKLIAGGISKRDAEIFIKHKIQGFNKTELGKLYGLDRRQIYRICKSLSIKYPA